ncbi:MAG: hypothetical protein ACKVIH_03190 [Burkholderiales bacterium]
MALLDPEADLSMSVVVHGASVLDILKRHKKPIVTDDLMEKFLGQDSRRTAVSFFCALEFLYTVGAIDHSKYRIGLHKTQEAR